jgi:hypothetical protein
LKILLHICCGPCAIYPVKYLRGAGHEVTGLFFNPNIHPYSEYRKRRETLLDYAARTKLNLLDCNDYPMEEFLRTVVGREHERCRHCYAVRLTYAARAAGEHRFNAFTSTVLYSRFQNHDLIRDMGNDIARAEGVEFFYHDFREGWKEGIDISKKQGMYRQQYCGCIYSEQERFDPRENIS